MNNKLPFQGHILTKRTAYLVRIGTFSLLLIFLIPLIDAETKASTINPLTKTLADTLYCQQNGDCTLENLTTLNIYNATQICLPPFNCISDWSEVNASGGGVPGGLDTQVQFNDGGTFGGNSDFTYVKAAGLLRIQTLFIDSDILISAGSIASSSGAISFANENLTTTAWMKAANFTATSYFKGNGSLLSNVCIDNGTGCPASGFINPATENLQMNTHNITFNDFEIYNDSRGLTFDMNKGAGSSPTFLFLKSEVLAVPSISTDTVGTFVNTGSIGALAKLSIIGGALGSECLNFGNTATENDGQICYDNSANSFFFKANSISYNILTMDATRFTFTDTGTDIMMRFTGSGGNGQFVYESDNLNLRWNKNLQLKGDEDSLLLGNGVGGDTGLLFNGVNTILSAILSVGSQNFSIEGFNTVNIGNNLNVSNNITSDNVYIPQYIFSHTNETIAVLGASQWTNVSFSQEDSDIKQGITHTYNSAVNHTFTILKSGVYNVDYDLDVEDTSVGASNIDVAARLIYVNGTEVQGSVFETDITKQGSEIELSHNFLLIAAAEDVFVVQFIAQDEDVQISTHGTFGETPESVSILIQKIDNVN